MNNWDWLFPFVGGLISGAVLIWNNRQRPHDVLKTYVEIFNDLPSGDMKDRLWTEIEQRLQVLTTPREGGQIGRQMEAPIQSELQSSAPVFVRSWGYASLFAATVAIGSGVYLGYSAAEIVIILAFAVGSITLLAALFVAVFRR